MVGKKVRTVRLVIFIVSLTRCLAEGCDPVSVIKGKTIDTSDDFKGTVVAQDDGGGKEECNQACCDTETCVIAVYEKHKKRCTLFKCEPVGDCPITDANGSVLTFFGEVHDPMVNKRSQVTATTDKNTNTIASTTKLPTGDPDDKTDATKPTSEISSAKHSTTQKTTDKTTDKTKDKTKDKDNKSKDMTTNENTSAKVSTTYLPTGRDKNTTHTPSTGSELTSKQSTNLSSTLESSLPSTPVSLSTLLSGTLIASTGSPQSPSTTGSASNTVTGSSASPSTSIILTALTTPEPAEGKAEIEANQTIESTLNETLEHITNVTETEETKVTLENNTSTIVSSLQNVSSINNVNGSTEFENVTAEQISKPSTFPISEGGSSASSTPYSGSTPNTMWPFNLSAVSSITTLSTQTMSSFSQASYSSSSKSVSGQNLPSLSESTTSPVSAVASETSSGSSFRTSYISQSSETTESKGFGTSPLTTVSSAISGSNQTGNRKLGSGESDKMSGTLIAALCIGIILTFAVAVLFGKRVFDAWQRRHYNKMDYLINGMYG